jgi:hypothetical protein
MKFEIVGYIYDCITNTKFGHIDANGSRLNDTTDLKTVDLRAWIMPTFVGKISKYQMIKLWLLLNY